MVHTNKKVIIFTTGGTIAMSEDAETHTVKPGEHNVLTNYLPYIASIAEIEMIDLLNLPSPHIRPDHMFKLAHEIQAYVNKEDISGIVVTHGTDTLEETAYYLDLVTHTQKPIVVTGAMRSNNELGSDGPINLISSVRVAASDAACGKGVLVVFNDEIHAARHVTKTHTSNVATFQSPSFGPIGSVTKRDIHFQRGIVKNEIISMAEMDKEIWLLKAFAGMDAKLISYASEQNIDGIVIEALGQGNLPPAVLPGIESLLEKGIPIVLVSRCFNGIVEDVYGYEGGGKQLKDLGIIFSNGLNGQKARIKLMSLLAAKTDINKIRASFEE